MAPPPRPSGDLAPNAVARLRALAETHHPPPGEAERIIRLFEAGTLTLGSAVGKIIVAAREARRAA